LLLPGGERGLAVHVNFRDQAAQGKDVHPLQVMQHFGGQLLNGTGIEPDFFIVELLRRNGVLLMARVLEEEPEHLEVLLLEVEGLVGGEVRDENLVRRGEQNVRGLQIAVDEL
jgi:hypothetical protein